MNHKYNSPAATLADAFAEALAVTGARSTEIVAEVRDLFQTLVKSHESAGSERGSTETEARGRALFDLVAQRALLAEAHLHVVGILWARMEKLEAEAGRRPRKSRIAR